MIRSFVQNVLNLCEVRQATHQRKENIVDAALRTNAAHVPSACEELTQKEEHHEKRSQKTAYYVRKGKAFSPCKLSFLLQDGRDLDRGHGSGGSSGRR